MPSNSEGPGNPGDAGLPPELDPRRGRAREPVHPAQLPPELDPRGRRRARRAEPGRVPPAVRRSQNPAAGKQAKAGNGKKDIFRGATLGIQIVAAILSLVILVGSGWAWAQYRSFSGNIKRISIAHDGSNAASKNIDGSDQNILIVGNDDRSTATPAELAQLGTTEDGGSLNTDTMMLMHVPADGSKATVISFPRDSYVDIPGHGKAKLNSAYTDGLQDSNGDKAAGASLLISTIENLTQLKIDHFVQVDLIGFYRISNAIGGVTVCLNNAMGPAKSFGQVGDGFDSGFEPNGQFVYSYSGINLKKGDNVIKGTQALAFVRQRHGLPNSDLDRIKRQQYFLSAVFRKVASAGTLLNPLKLQNLLKAISSSLTMDSSLNPLKLAQQMQNLQAGNVTFTTIPTSGFANEDVGSVVVVNTEAMPDFIDTLIGNSAATALKNAKPASPASVTVTVVNDANANGLENTNAAALRQAGFKTVIPPASSDVLAKTTIRYATGQEAAAKAVQAQVPGAVLERSADVTGVTLLLGNNGIQVKSLMPATPTTPAAPAKTTAIAAAPVSTAPGNTTVTTAADAGCIN
ncbi:LCP family protein [Jatrophihabitans sp. DSM 45814]